MSKPAEDCLNSNAMALQTHGQEWVKDNCCIKLESMDTCRLSEAPCTCETRDNCRKKTDSVPDKEPQQDTDASGDADTSDTGPAEVKEFETAWEARGDGATHFLDRQDVDCRGAPMTGFVLQTEGEGDGRRLAYAFTCLEAAGLDNAVGKSTPVQDNGDGNLIFLDRLNVDCGAEAALSQFHLVRDGDTQQHYAYTCLSGVMMM